MQKLSRQLGRSGSAPLHQHRVGGGGGGGGGIQPGGGGLEKASAPESRKYRQPFCDKLFFGWSAPRAHAAPRHRRHRHRHRHRRHGKPRRTDTRTRTRTRTRWKSLDTLSKKRGVKGRPCTAAIFYACGALPRTGVFVEHAGTDGGWAWKWREKERIRRG